MTSDLSKKLRLHAGLGVLVLAGGLGLLGVAFRLESIGLLLTAIFVAACGLGGTGFSLYRLFLVNAPRH